MSKLSEIKDGYGNLIIKKTEIEKLAEARLEICEPCEENSKNRSMVGGMIPFCNKCGCVLEAKTRSADSICPLGKW